MGRRRKEPTPQERERFNSDPCKVCQHRWDEHAEDQAKEQWPCLKYKCSCVMYSTGGRHE